ncbi:lasso peptide biosynthesis PqqD family chaperone [Paenibacillus sp. sptzw28]|uniref:lasso peptide biosynthesis PqqD family chaperone n=1 Tax=Paenibacillus sp. sptzw28 TaxID=715179 RepID=UPI001C6E17E5|nr:lasso peptide biosynthesis PqqD family chaperone [Paenibacillus sp. sptzw28]QYR20612.1 lasso peptide biosynthesis PqqD family chaperone [Paenibacillus sp. sptzw28]
MQTQTFSPEQVVLQAKGNLVSNMDGEKVMMSINNGKYYNLGQVGGRIWEIIESPVSVEQITSVLLSEYDIDREACSEQVVNFLQLLHKEGLIQTESREEG